jgi:hypothetical protein
MVADSLGVRDYVGTVTRETAEVDYVDGSSVQEERKGEDREEELPDQNY